MYIVNPALCSLFFNDTATTEIYTLSLHDALPIWWESLELSMIRVVCCSLAPCRRVQPRSEEHTSELQSRLHLVCRLLLEKTYKMGIHIMSCWDTHTRPYLIYLSYHC